jgi:DNA-binding transcriptional LysR family regulator
MRVSRMQLTENGDAVLEECVSALKTASEAEESKNTPLSVNKLEELLKKKRGEG